MDWNLIGYNIFGRALFERSMYVDIWKENNQPIQTVQNLQFTNLATHSNQIYLVTFMCLTIDTSFIFT